MVRHAGGPMTIRRVTSAIVAAIMLAFPPAVTHAASPSPAPSPPSTAPSAAHPSARSSVPSGAIVLAPAAIDVGAAPTAAGLARVLAPLLRDRDLGRRVGAAVLDAATGDVLYAR